MNTRHSSFSSLSQMGSIHNGYQPTITLPSTQTKLPKIKWDWQQKCAQLNKEQLLDELHAFFKVENRGFLNDPNSWIDQNLPPAQFFDATADIFLPYVLKLEVNQNTEIAFHGDIHGDKDSLIAYITWLAEHGYMDNEDPFKIKKDNFYIIFLGDYTDRGQYGTEVIFTLMRLKRTNPDKVFLVRGNHEDVDLNTRYGFTDQLKNKFKDDGLILKTIKRMYNYLPVALYLVCNNGTKYKDVLLCCHGGVEVGFNNAKKLFENDQKIACVPLGPLTRATNCKQLKPYMNYIKKLSGNDDFIPASPNAPHHIHFLWNDFDVDNNCTMVITDRGWECDKAFTDFVNNLQSTTQCQIRGIFRGHQHGDHKMMARILNRDNKNPNTDIGVGKLWIKEQSPKAGALWHGIVCTFSVCPNTGYGKDFNYNYDAFGILKMATIFEDWKLDMHRITPSQ